MSTEYATFILKISGNGCVHIIERDKFRRYLGKKYDTDEGNSKGAKSL